MRRIGNGYMVKRVIFPLFIFLLIPAVGYGAPKSRPLFVPGQILVKFKEGTNLSLRERIQARLKARILRKLALVKAYQLHLIGNLSLEEALENLRKDPHVEYASPNYYRYISVVPSDAAFQEMWGLNNTGQTGGAIDADIDAPEAWDIVTGSEDVVVAVIDSGCQLDHVDLAQNIWVNPGEDLNENGVVDPGEVNGIDDDANGFVDDFHGWDFAREDNDPSASGGGCFGHGTHTAGTIAAVGDNGIGVTGVSWKAKLMTLNAFIELLGIFCAATDADLIEAIHYASMMGAQVINASWGGGSPNPAMEDAIRASNALFVAAAGNGGADLIGDDNDLTPHYPSNYDLDNVVAVAATDHQDSKSFFSNFGAGSVDLGAPGDNILSTLPFNDYGSFFGTSMAAPHVAGVAGLLLAQDKDYTLLELKWRLLAGVDPVAGLAGQTVTGGRLNALKSLTLPQAREVGVTADLEPIGSTTVPPGSPLDFSINIENHTPNPVSIGALFYLKGPTGHAIPLAGPFFDTIPGGATASEEASLPIPRDAPTGTYRIFSLVVNPDNIEEDRVEYLIVP